MAIKLLIVEGDKDLISTLSACLEGKNMKIFKAPDELAAKKILAKKKIDVVLLGVTSFKRRALELLKWLKSKDPLTQVILINNSEQLALSIEGMKLGAFDDFLLPIDLEALTQSIKEAWKTKKNLTKSRGSFLDRCRKKMVAVNYTIKRGKNNNSTLQQIKKKSRGSVSSTSVTKETSENIPYYKKKKKQKLLIDPKRTQKKEAKMEEIKILLVDDEKEFVTTLAERLQMRDLNLNIALNGEQALKIVKDEIPDVMILDLRMPGIDGMEVLRRVRKAYPEVKVIILTGHGTKKDEEEAKRLGAFDYLKKPVDIYTLIETIKKAYKTKIDRTMVAATFAEAGEFKTAKDILNENLDKKQSKDSQ